MPIIRSCAKRGCRGDANTGRRGFCALHVRTTSERGYGVGHQGGRAELARTLPAPCAYGCGRILRPGTRWHASHVVDGDPSAGLVAACETCNQRAKGGQLRPLPSAIIVGVAA